MTIRKGDKVATPNGAATIGLIMGDRVRCDFPDFKSCTFDREDVVPLNPVERESATVLPFKPKLRVIQP